MSNEGGDDRDPGDEPNHEEGDRPEADTVSLSLDETLELLANRDRRRIVGYLMNAPDGTATADELVDHLTAEWSGRSDDRPGRGHVSATLHHVHLPKLADAGVVDYDPRNMEVRYWQADRLEQWYDRITDHEED